MTLPGLPGVLLAGGYDSGQQLAERRQALYDAAHGGWVEIPPYAVWTGDEGEFVAGVVDDAGEVPAGEVRPEVMSLIAGDCRRRFEGAAAHGGDGFADLRIRRP